MKLSPTDISTQLRGHLLFRSLSSEQMHRACHGAVVVNVKKNMHLFEQGDEAHSFYYLLEGQIKLTRISLDGDEKIIEIIYPGGTFAEALMFLQFKSYPVGSQALKNSKLIRINCANYYDVMRESVDTCLALLGDLSGRLHALINEIDSLTLHSALCRVAGYLVSREPEHGLEFDLDVPKLALASRLAVKPETFSRIIKQLCSDELIRINGNRINIIDLDRLRDFSDYCVQPGGNLVDSFKLKSQ